MKRLSRPALEDKELFNPEEAVIFYNLSRRKFKRLIDGGEKLPFVALYNERKLIIRSEFEKFMAEHPEMKEGLRNGKPPIPKKT